MRRNDETLPVQADACRAELSWLNLSIGTKEVSREREDQGTHRKAGAPAGLAPGIGEIEINGELVSFGRDCRA
jgi:hypothetical protein